MCLRRATLHIHMLLRHSSPLSVFLLRPLLHRQVRLAPSPTTTGRPCCTLSSMASSIAEQKKALRTRIRKELRLHHPSLRTEDVLIQKHILDAPWYKKSRVICAYISTPTLREVDTALVVSDVLQMTHSDFTKMLYVPWIEDKESHMKFFQITSNEDLQANSMGILEPRPIDDQGIPREDVMQAKEPIDLILLPGLAFDKAGGRLGRGGGYYDTFLSKYLAQAKERGWNPPLRVGMAYSLQILKDPVPTDARDVPVDALVSASGLLSVTNHFRLLEN